MTLITYSNGPTPSTPSSIIHARGLRGRRLTGTAHRGSNWTNAVRVLRAAVENAAGHAAGGRDFPAADVVGDTIIDHIGGLDRKSLEVLDVVFTMLVRASSKRS